MEDRGLQVIDAQAIEIAPTLTVEQFEKRLAEFREFTKRNLRADVDYGIVPGTPKPTLLKPGAEKVMRWYGLVVDIEILPTSRTDILDGVLDFDLRGTVRHARSGAVLGTVHANANSEERRYRNARLPNPDRPDKDPQTIADQKNTILKMGDKRVWVAAALLYTGASEAYTQDLEDSAPGGEQRRRQEGIPTAADAPPDCPGYCAVHTTPFRLVPAGISKKRADGSGGKAYNAFWACPERGCREKATEFPEETEAPPADPDTPTAEPPADGDIEATERTALLLSLRKKHPGAKALMAVNAYCTDNNLPPVADMAALDSLSIDLLNAVLDK